ncbi:tRNA pseudouridine(38-40) synthase TruA [Methanobrevibacter sp.]
MKRRAFKVGYIGSNFYGFQRQPNLRTVEGEIIDTLIDIGYMESPEDGRFRIAGRTDGGVNSLGNVVSFQSEEEFHINKINSHLPDDVQFLAEAPVRFGFKPRYAKERWYRYILFNNDIDLEKLKEVSKLFVGTHNFTNFTKRYQKTTVRTINKINIIDTKIDVDERLNRPYKTNDFDFNQNFPNLNESYRPIFIDVYGESFLWNMVRKMMRVFLDYSMGKLTLDDVNNYLNPGGDDKRENIKVLSGENLILMDTIYDNIKFKYDDYAVEKFKRYLASQMVYHQKSYGIVESILNSF